MNQLANLSQVLQMRLATPGLETPAWLGSTDGTIAVKSGSNEVYVTLLNGQVVTAVNRRVPNDFFQPIMVGVLPEDANDLQVLRVRNAYLEVPSNVPDHAQRHQWPYPDTLWIRPEQFLAGLAIPVSGMVVKFFATPYYLEGFKYCPDFTRDYTSLIPVSGAVWCVTEIDSAGVLSDRLGDSVGDKYQLTFANIPTPSATLKMLFAVKLWVGQTAINKTGFENDIFDPRFSGVATGGISSAVDWDNITDVPATFPPDLSYSDVVYSRRWLKFADPAITDDNTEGYGKLHFWLNQTSGQWFVCTDDATGAAVWVTASGGGGGGGATPVFNVDGTLAVYDNASMPIVITSGMTISTWTLYLENLGTSGSTIIDIILHRVGEADISVFDGGTLPEIAFDDANGLVTATPTVTEFFANDVLTLNIEQVAPASASLVVAGLSSSEETGGGGVTVTDGITEVVGAGSLEFGKVVDTGGGTARVGVIMSITTVQTRTQTIYTAYATGDGNPLVEMDLVLTPRSAGNKIILEWVINGEADEDVVFTVLRNGTLLANSVDGSNNRFSGVASFAYDNNNNSTASNMVIKIIDENSLDVETTYQVCVRSSYWVDQTFSLNRTIDPPDDLYETMLSVGTAWEINQ